MNLDDLPRRALAKKMLKAVSPIYSQSYVLKTFYDALFAELEDAIELFHTLREQRFPATVSLWGIEYLERKYSIEPDNSLTLEQRRAQLKRRSWEGNYPLNPAMLEKYGREALNFICRIDESRAGWIIMHTEGFNQDGFERMLKYLIRARPAHLALEMSIEWEDTNEIGIAHPEIFANVDTVDSAGVVDSKDEIFISNNAVDAPQDTVDYDFIANQINVDRLSVGNYLWDNDYEIFDAAPASTDEEERKFEWDFFLWKLWLKWKRHPLVKKHQHHFDDDDTEIDPDDPEPEEPFPYGRDFLRLYWKFEDNRIRTTTVLNPRKDILGRDINSVGTFATANRVVLNSRGYPTTGIIRALIVTKSYEHLLGNDGLPRIHPPKDDNGKFPKQKG